VSRFFRNQLQPIQTETGVIIVFNHHLGKPSQNQQQRQGPAHYQGLGSSDIVNWTRETITLADDGAGSYRLEFGKRAKRAGFKELYLKHSSDGIRWERSEGISTAEDAKKVAEEKKRAKLEECVRGYGLVTLQQMKENAKSFGYNQHNIKTALDALSQNSADGENPIYYYKAHVNGADATSTVYSINPKPEDGHVKSRDLNAPDFVVQLNGQNVQL